MKFSLEQYVSPKWITLLYVLLAVVIVVLLLVFQDIFQILLSTLLGIFFIWIFLKAWKGFFHYFFPDSKDLE
jgi:hypothetical protein